MGKRSIGCRGRSSSVLERGLRHHIEEHWQSNKFTTDQLVEYLRSAFPEYSRQKLQPFRRRVQEIRQSLKNTSTKYRGIELSDVNDDSSTPSHSYPHKKTKKMDRSEQMLLEMETQHIERNRKQQQQHTSYSSSSFGSVSAASDKEEASYVLTSDDDAVYGEHLEPDFDLIKSMLRKSYSKAKNSEKPKSVEKKNLKPEAVHTNDKALPNEGYAVQAVQSRPEKDTRLDDNVGVDKGRNDGPMFRDLGGMTNVLKQMKMEVIYPLKHPELLQWLGVSSMTGILLHGPPGCGKTKLAHAIANESGLPFYKISSTELVSGVSGESEENIRALFSKAYRTAPSIVFIDEIDAIASKRENVQREMERRIVTQLMTCMDESQRFTQPTDSNADSGSSDGRPGRVLVIGATNRPDALDPALRRPGRFDKEIALGVPDEEARLEILSVVTRNMRLEGTFDLLKIAKSTPGFVGADLAAISKFAGYVAMKRIGNQREYDLSTSCMDEQQLEDWFNIPWSLEEMQNLSITMSDFEEAAKMVQPSSRREGFSSIPHVTWEDVGGLDLLRQEFDLYIVGRIKYPLDYQEFGMNLASGFLLYGPPGCGKTLIAKAVANEAGANFIHIKGPEILNKYVGESELAVRTIFNRARTCSPCILFFDEVDALTTKRGKEGGWVVERLLNQLLIELDGADQRKGVYVIGATNRPEVIDPAVLRPGRLGNLLYVPLPNPDQRGQILKAHAKNKPLDPSVDLVAIGRREACSNLSGADLASLMEKASAAALKERLIQLQSSTEKKPAAIKPYHFEQALGEVSRSVSDKEKQYYDKLAESFRAT